MMNSGHGFTIRAIFVGLLVGSILCCSNLYFGLQSGWVTMGSIQSALLGFGVFRLLQRHGYGKGFSVAENTIIQTISVAVATMPVTAGFISVIPALGMFTTEDNPPNGPLSLNSWHLILWTFAVAFFGAFSALPLRNQTIIKEKLKFPSGTATAKVIALLHENQNSTVHVRHDSIEDLEKEKNSADEMEDIEQQDPSTHLIAHDEDAISAKHPYGLNGVMSNHWSKALPLLIITFFLAFGYKLIAEFVKSDGDRIFASFSIFSWLGLDVLTRWGWVLYPAPGYIGQGMIMGPKTCISMLAGAITGFGILGPIARWQNWAPSEINNLENGAAGWILWISLAVMLGDSLTSLSILTIKTFHQSIRNKRVNEDISIVRLHEVPQSWWIIGLLVSTGVCTLIVPYLFSMPWYEPLLAVVLAAFVAILAVRALGETDLNPASGIGKISQIVFSLVAPGKIVANVVAGAIAEAGAIQAGDMMQDFKTAHLLGVPPKPQFFAQLIGSFVSVFLTVGVYSLYKIAWDIPGKELEVPSANVWLDMARLFNGGSLPEKVYLFATIFAITAALLVLAEKFSDHFPPDVMKMMPSGIGFAVGMYVSPKYTIPRLIGCLIERLWYYHFRSTHSDLMIVVASGFVLGEGMGAILIAFVKLFQTIV